MPWYALTSSPLVKTRVAIGCAGSLPRPRRCPRPAAAAKDVSVSTAAAPSPTNAHGCVENSDGLSAAPAASIPAARCAVVAAAADKQNADDARDRRNLDALRPGMVVVEKDPLDETHGGFPLPVRSDNHFADAAHLPSTRSRCLCGNESTTGLQACTVSNPDRSAAVARSVLPVTEASRSTAATSCRFPSSAWPKPRAHANDQAAEVKKSCTGTGAAATTEETT